MPDQPTAITYAAAGVDVEAGDKAVELMKESVRRATRPEVLGGLGGFAGMFDASALARYRHPVLATSTDGVGTKVAIAQALDRHDTIGYDLVGMVVDDIVVCGAEPLFMTDYIACGHVVPERIAAVVGGIAAACAQARVALVGGETAEHPGLLGPDDYDVAGAATGVVEHDAVLGPDRVRPGDVVLGLASSGLHSNGYSLVRRVVAQAGWALDRHVDELGRTLGEELLTPTRVYTADLLDLLRADGAEVHALSHVTGGGLAANLARVLPPGTHARLDRATWTPPAVFTTIGRLGAVPRTDLERTLNMGVGFVAVLPPEAVDAARTHLTSRGIGTWVMGEVRDAAAVGATGGDVTRGAKGVDGGAVELVGEHPPA
ncbi:phosphoribosylformylglycinamidine cyclo-ligase [Phycicoccus endophyticus]|uniref:Phosphoribosylformylglycinamidine cyclo-ligase n=1 Tax=Phycicoccus endophyticus TaxID=1690220 RepID=A0A7G9R6A5_9MICO|nr:phosphoribosylformylglycinamidine cyclo-ligase [Phycicoccus endophyticus]QNN51130.1 phosphoribosylformylglycinamidine cyclo-ligase [Phycicoccus endophyticus]GGL37235.1 phosphoribosylformylglycinamidine cyclo-ligase [Phycicoccus endophyticus]